MYVYPAHIVTIIPNQPTNHTHHIIYYTIQVACYPSFGGNAEWILTQPRVYMWQWKPATEARTFMYAYIRWACEYTQIFMYMYI